MKEKEIFKDVKGYEGSYQVSNLGRVKSLARKGSDDRQLNGKILKTYINDRGYLVLGLCKDGKAKTFKVHKLVAMAFLGHVPNGHKIVVDHIDGNPLNNRLENLQLITNRENCSKDKKGYSSQYTGVYWSKGAKKWHAQIRIYGKLRHLGYFTNEIDASNAYQSKLNEIII